LWQSLRPLRAIRSGDFGAIEDFFSEHTSFLLSALERNEISIFAGKFGRDFGYQIRCR
jgi:hypothetical protein